MPSSSQKELEDLTAEVEQLKSKLQASRSAHEDTNLLKYANERAKPLDKLHMKARRQLKGHLAKVYSIQWASDHRKLVSASQDGKLIVWDAFKTHKLNAIGLKSSWVMTCATSPSQAFVACGGLDNTCTIYAPKSDEESTKIARTLMGHEGFVSSCQFLPNERQILTASGDATSILWDIETGEKLRTFKGHASDVFSISVSTDGRSFVSGSADAACRVWDIRSGKCTHWFENHESDVNSVKFYPSDDTFGSGSDDDTCKLFDIRADQLLMSYERDVIVAGVTSIDFSLSGRLLFSGHDDFQVNVWDVLRAERVAVLSGHEHQISCLGVSSDGTALATGSWDSLIKIWA